MTYLRKGNSQSVTLLKAAQHAESGQVLVEFALVFMLWVIMVLAILEMVLFMHTYNVLADSAVPPRRSSFSSSQPARSAPSCWL
jgi:TadE-like protein